MSDLLTKHDVRDIIREEVPQIVADAINANNEVIFTMFKSEILAIYEEFAKMHEKFEKVNTKLDKQEKSIESLQSDVTVIKTDLHTFKKKTSSQFQDLHADLTMTVSYRPIIKDHERRIYALEQGVVQDKN